MMVLDAGAFVALERNDRAMWRRLKGALIDGEPPVTRGSVVGPLTPAAASTSFPPRRRFSAGHWTREIATDRPRRLSSYRTQELDEE